jgi:DNA-binding HxlR family transcriptional regulator
MTDLSLNEADEAILSELRQGRATATYLEERIDWSRQYLTQRLRRLEEHDIITNLEETGLYELNE